MALDDFSFHASKISAQAIFLKKPAFGTLVRGIVFFPRVHLLLSKVEKFETPKRTLEGFAGHVQTAQRPRTLQHLHYESDYPWIPQGS